MYKYWSWALFALLQETITNTQFSSSITQLSPLKSKSILTKKTFILAIKTIIQYDFETGPSEWQVIHFTQVHILKIQRMMDGHLVAHLKHKYLTVGSSNVAHHAPTVT